jgi:hypothetical protein
MIHNLKRTFQLLVQLNLSALSKKDLVECEENLKDYLVTIKELKNTLDILNSCNEEKIIIIRDNLLNLHMKYLSLIWQFDEIVDLLSKFLDFSQFKSSLVLKLITDSQMDNISDYLTEVLILLRKLNMHVNNRVLAEEQIVKAENAIKKFINTDKAINQMFKITAFSSQQDLKTFLLKLIDKYKIIILSLNTVDTLMREIIVNYRELREKINTENLNG